MFLSPTHLHSRMCIRIYVFNFRKKIDKITRRQKAKGTKEEKTISVENLRSNFKVTLLKRDSNTGVFV